MHSGMRAVGFPAAITTLVIALSYSVTPVTNASGQDSHPLVPRTDTMTACPAKADYRFQNTLNTSVGAAPALTNLGSNNTFINATVDGVNRRVLQFPQRDGVLLDPSSTVISAQVYTIVILFSFSDVTDFRRILDFKHGTDDSGLYVFGGRLSFYPVGDSTTTPIAANTYVQVTLTRDAGKNVIGYVNGVQTLSFVDTGDLAVIDSSSQLRFFRDNDTGGPSDESSAGTVARIRLYDCVFSPAEVNALDRLPAPPAAGCPVVDSFNPTVGFPGSAVTIAGSGFTGVTAVRFAPSNNASFLINNDSQITAVVAPFSVNGPITLVKAGCSDTVTAQFTVLRPLACVSAATFQSQNTPSESIVACFGNGLATTTIEASGVPLPTSLAGTTLTFRDSASIERTSPLFFVSPTQLNFQVPSGVATGLATLTAISSDGVVSRGQVTVTIVQPGILTANANGLGVPAAYAIRVRPGNIQIREELFEYQDGVAAFVPTPIDLGPPEDQVFLVLFGTGWRFRSALAGVSLTVGGVNSQVTFAGAQGSLVGVDQVNALIPRSLIGRGEVNVNLVVDSVPARAVVINIK